MRTRRAAERRGSIASSFEGVVNNLQRRYGETSSDYVKEEIEKFMSASVCPACKGARLKPEALAVTVGGANIDELTRMSIEQLEDFFGELTLTRDKNRSRIRSSRRSERGSAF